MASHQFRQVKTSVRNSIDAQENQIQAFTANLNNFLGKNVRKIVKGVEAGDVNALEAAKVLGGIQDSLVEAGLDDELAKVTDLYGQELNRIASVYEDVSGKELIWSHADLDLTQELVSFNTDNVSNHVTAAIGDMKTVIMQAVITGVQPDINSIIDDGTGRLQANIATELRTQMMAFNRSMSIRKGQEDFGKDVRFLYVGPDDKVTREFCRDRVDKVFTQEEIDSWDNGTELPANIYLGGYNCRHHLQPISQDEAANYESGDDVSPDEGADE